MNGGRPGPPKRPRRTFETRSADDAVKAVLKLYGISEEIRAQRVLTEWADLVGPRIAQRTRPYGVNERTLIIEVASSAWLQELNLLRTQILMGLTERLGNPRLFDDLKFKLAGSGRGGALRPEFQRPPHRPVPLSQPAPLPATGVAREQIVREVDKVDDLELRELIARVRINNDR